MHENEITSLTTNRLADQTTGTVAATGVGAIGAINTQVMY